MPPPLRIACRALRGSEFSGGRVIHRERLTATGEAIGTTIGFSYKVIVDFAESLLQSDRGCPYKVIVDNSFFPIVYKHATKWLRGRGRARLGSPSLGCGRGFGGSQAFGVRPIRPLIGGRLCRSRSPSSSISIRAARYWVSTSDRVLRKAALKLSMRP